MVCKLIRGKPEEEERRICLNCPFPQCAHDLEKTPVTLSTREENKDKVAAYQRRYREENKDKVAAYHRRYREENRLLARC